MRHLKRYLWHSVNSAVVINDTLAPYKYPNHQSKPQGHNFMHNIGLKLNLLLTNGKASLSLVPSLSGRTGQPDNNYSCIVKAKSQFWESLN